MIKQAHILLPLLLVCLTGTIAEAQLFGSRSLGQPLERRVGPSRFGQAGELQGSERFVRGNRGRSEFVGADQREQSGFVGLQQAQGTGPVVTSTTGVRTRPDRGSQINQPVAPLADGDMYHPRLRLDFVPPERSFQEVGSRLTEQLSTSPRLTERSRIAVSVEGRTAILQGEVASAAERDLAQLVALLEPGISRVKNELEVVRSLPARETPSAAGSPR